MPKTFTCCEFVKRAKEHLVNANKWAEEDKYKVLEFVHKLSFKLVNTESKWDEKLKENVYKENWDCLFCNECKKWFLEQQEKQLNLIDSQIEKAKVEGKFYTDPNVREMLERSKKRVDKYQKNNQEPPLSFGKSPQE